jgi:hypothetical protein
VAVGRCLTQHIVGSSKAHGIGAYVLLKESGIIPTFLGQIDTRRAGRLFHVNVIGELGNIIQKEIISLIVRFLIRRLVGVLSIVTTLAIPVRQ